MNANDPAIGYPRDNNRLVQQWAWFSVEYPGSGSSSDLTTATGEGSYTITSPGVRYQTWAGQVSTQSNLYPVWVSAQGDQPGDLASPVTMTLKAEVGNNGNATLDGTVTVTFYSDAALTNPIGSTTVSAVPGCARQGRIAEVQWANVSAGVHKYWVKVDSSNAVAEVSENDNVMQGMFIASGLRTFLPLAMRTF